jgi:F-type H+-transporting ATPase subunit b
MTPINYQIIASSSSSGLGALGVDSSALVIQLITFVLALLVLRKWAFNPIIKILQQRRQLIEDGVKLGEKMRHDEAALEDKIEKTLHLTRVKADQIITDANQTAKIIIKDAENDAKAKADLILKESEIKANQELARAKQKLAKEMVNLVASATSIVLDEKVDAHKDASLIERALAGRKA